MNDPLHCNTPSMIFTGLHYVDRMTRCAPSNEGVTKIVDVLVPPADCLANGKACPHSAHPFAVKKYLLIGINQSV